MFQIRFRILVLCISLLVPASAFSDDLKQSCKDGTGQSCFDKALALHEATASYEDFVKTREAYQRACDLDHPDACLILGFFFEHGWAGKRNAKSSWQLFEKSCKLGYKPACGKRPKEIPQALAKEKCDGGDKAACIELLSDKEACHAGYADACLRAHRSCKSRCKDFLMSMCILGDRWNVLNLGEGCPASYISLPDIPADPKKARKVLAKMCNGGNADACSNVADMWKEGVGGKKSAKKAKRYHKAARKLYESDCNNNEDGAACSAAGDMTRAESIYHRKCQQESGEDCLGLFYILKKNGKLVDSYQTAVKACNLGAAVGCFRVSEALEEKFYSCENAGDNCDGLQVQGDNYWSLAQLHGIDESYYLFLDLFQGQTIPPVAGLSGDYSQVLSLLSQQCDNDDGMSCYAMALEPHWKTTLTVKELLNRACVLGIADACISAERHLAACRLGVSDQCIHLLQTKGFEVTRETNKLATSSFKVMKVSIPYPNADSSKSKATTPLVKYRARLSWGDHENKKGKPLKSASQVVAQDRARVHRYNAADAEDKVDTYFTDKEKRKELQSRLKKGIPEEMEQKIMNGTPLIEVTVWKTKTDLSILGE